MNTPANTTEPKTTLQLPKETASLIKASLAGIRRTGRDRGRGQDAGVKGFISGHSLRVGSAVSLAQAGATVVDMQVAGRWKSSQMPAHYAKAELAERGAIARFKDGKR